MYGCNARGVKILPALLDRASESFEFRGCSFGISKCKAGTGRVVHRPCMCAACLIVHHRLCIES